MFDYSFTVAYLSAKETAILTKEALSRMGAEGKDPVSSLSSAGYGIGGSTVSQMTDNELSALRKFIMESLPDTLYPLLILPYDAHNLKVLLKSAVNGKDPSPYLYDNTVFDTEIAAACCRGGEFSLLSDIIAEKLDLAYDEGTLSTPFGISVSVDRAFHTDVCQRAEKAAEPIREYVRATTDGKNFLSFVRAKRIGMSEQTLSEIILPGGSVSPSVFTEAYDAGADGLYDRSFGMDAHDVFLEAAERMKTSLSVVSDLFDEYAYSKLEPYRFEPDSPVPVFLYFIKKTAEARHVREAFFGNGGAV